MHGPNGLFVCLFFLMLGGFVTNFQGSAENAESTGAGHPHSLIKLSSNSPTAVREKWPSSNTLAA